MLYYGGGFDMKVLLNYTVKLGKYDGNEDVFEWEIETADEDIEKAITRAIMTGTYFEDVPELQALCDIVDLSSQDIIGLPEIELPGYIIQGGSFPELLRSSSILAKNLDHFQNSYLSGSQVWICPPSQQSTEE